MKPAKLSVSTFLVCVSALLAAVLAGCALPEAKPDLTRYYLLTSSTTNPPEETAGARWQLGLRPVEVAPFLKHRAMLLRRGTNEVRFVEEARWAEPLEAGVARVLRESLETRRDVARVANVTRSSEAARDYDVLVRIQRCEGVPERGLARFEAIVEIYTTDLDPVRVGREVVTAETGGWDANNYEDLARKLSAALEQVADRAIALLPPKEAGSSGNP